jgi:hypothetical protein
VAIFHLNARIVSRGKGQSAVAKAAYNSHDLLTNENTGDRHDYRDKGEVVFSGIFAPKSAPEWVDEITKSREALWSAVEKAETRKNSQLAREIEIALPHELTDEQRKWLVTDFVRENFVRPGMIADVAIHAPSPEGDKRNHHAHILLTMRHIGPEGFVEKMREYNGKAHLQEWREKWEHLANRYLERFGHEARIDNRTLEAQGIDREPTSHVGPTATDFEREGTKTERGGINRAIKARNRLRDKLKAQAMQTGRDLEEVRAEYMAKAAEEIRAAWKASSDGLDFMMELNNRGFCLAQDGKTHYAAVDANGLAHRLDEKTYGYLTAPDMSAAIEAARRDCNALIIPTVQERRQELREQREQRRSSSFAATLYNRAGMVSMQRDAIRHLKDARRAQAFKTKDQARREHLQREQRERREEQEALHQKKEVARQREAWNEELPDRRDTMEMWRTSRERVPEQTETRAADHKAPASTPPVIHAKPQVKEIEALPRVQEAARSLETLRQAEEVARQREALRQKQELIQQQEAQRLKEELARQQEQKKKEREQQRQKEERERRERQEQQERQRQEREQRQTKQAPRDQVTEKSEHKRATTEQTDAKQRRAAKQSAMERAFNFRATDEERARSGDHERERER